jgi:hypothetical protein
MKNILAIALLSTGIAIAITNSPAYAGQVENDAAEAVRRRERQVVQPNTPSTQPDSYDAAGFGRGLGVIFSVVNGIGVVSNQGVTMYGFRANFPIGEKIKLRAGAYTNFAGSSDPESNTINASLTYNFSDPGTTFNPFLGVGYGSNTIGKGGSNNSPGTSASSFYYTSGVDLNFSGIHLTTAINLPNNSAYGTEFQAAFNVGRGF